VCERACVTQRVPCSTQRPSDSGSSTAADGLIGADGQVNSAGGWRWRGVGERMQCCSVMVQREEGVPHELT
jgi:hypothetical protein